MEASTMASTTTPSNISNVSVICDTTTPQIYWIGINIPITIILLLVAPFCRCQVNPFKWICRPKLIYPVNFLDGYSNRVPYVFAFLVTSNVIIDLLQLSSGDQIFLAEFSATVRWSTSDIESFPNTITNTCSVKNRKFHTVFIWALIKYICIVIAGLVFYPLLLCITYSNFLTDVLGLMFTCNWFAMYIFIYTLCPTGSVIGVVNGLSYAPALVSCFGLSGFYLLRFMKRFQKRCIKPERKSYSPRENDDDKLKNTHFYERVQYLLTPTEKWKRNLKPDGKLKRLLRRVYPAFPGFRYSTRIVCTVGLSLIVLYQISILYIASILAYVQSIVNGILADIPGLNVFLLDIIELSFNLSSYPAVCISFINSLLFLRNYRENTRELWKGDRSQFSHKPIQAHSIVIACLSFSSLSIAYTFWGFVVLQVFLWILMFAIVSIIRFDLLVGLLQNYWMYVFGIILFVVIQQLLARFVLLRRNANGALVINNRHLFHIIVHFFFFLNIIVGLIGSLLRIIKVAVIGVLLIGRVDLCLAPRGFEWADRGFGAYRSFLELEVSLTHPVVITFCNLLNQSRRKRIAGDDVDVERQNAEVGVDGDISITDVAASWGTKDKTSTSRRVRNRWFKALTLIRNKRLVYERLHKLEESVDLTRILPTGAGKYADEMQDTSSTKTQDTMVEYTGY